MTLLCRYVFLLLLNPAEFDTQIKGGEPESELGYNNDCVFNAARKSDFCCPSKEKRAKEQARSCAVN